MRGLIMTPAFRVEGSRLEVDVVELDPQELRQGLLFWDMIDYPESMAISFGLSRDEQFLVDAGAMRRTVTPMASGDGVQIMLWSHLKLFSDLQEAEPGVWSLSATAGTSLAQDTMLDPRSVIQTSLYNALPVPTGDAPLQEILEFRERRDAELTSLRSALDGAYQRVVSAGDGELQLVAEVEAIQRAVADYAGVAKEAKFPLRLTDLSAQFGLGYDLKAGAAGMLAAYSLNNDYLTAAAGALWGLEPKFEAGVKVAGAPAAAADETAFRYIANYHDEIAWSPEG